ncbi:MAG TPA: hypothetical protein VHO29_12385 [Marmoricola sp.]|nr:hypothetical protein [Marmoricola sp.]
MEEFFVAVTAGVLLALAIAALVAARRLLTLTDTLTDRRSGDD